MYDAIRDIIGADNSSIAWWQVLIRAAIVFSYGVFLVRVGARRMFGHNAAFDIVLAVILGSLLSRAITGNAPFFATMAAGALLVALHAILAALSFYSHFVGWLVKGEERQLVGNGSMDLEQMRRAKVSEADLHEALRLKGVDKVASVEAAYLERSGQISAVKRG